MTNIPNLFIFLLNAMNRIIIFIIALTLLFFIWGIFRLIFSGKDSKEREQARGYIVWGIISLAVMISVWGLVNLVTSSFGLTSAAPLVPGFPNPIF